MPFQRLTESTRSLVERARRSSPQMDVAIATVQRYSADDGGSYAAALTYYTFFSIFPLFLFAAALLGYLTFGDAEMQRRLIDDGVKAVPILRDALKPDGISALIENRHRIALVGAVLALYSGSGAVVALEHALNKLHGIGDEPGFLSKRIRSLKWLGILGAGVLLGVVIGAVAGSAADLFGNGAAVSGALSILAALVAVAVNTAVFAAAYRYLPAAEPPWKEVLPGAVVASIGFQVLNIAGTAYLAHGETARNDTFGTFAAAATLLVASYLIAQLTLLAAEVNLVLAERRGGSTSGAT